MVAAALSLTALCLTTLLPVPPATAHQSDPTIVTRVDAVEPLLNGVTVEVRAGVADQLLLVNATRTPVEVLGGDGRPFLRIGPATVDADVNAADWAASNSPLGTAPTGAASRPAQWRTVARGASWGWFDHRMHPAARPLTPELRNARRPVRLADWTVPLRQNGTTHEVKGHVEYRPVLGAFHTTVERRPAGLTADALDGRVPGLFVQWSGTEPLVIRGIAGEPFARLTPGGAEVNDASETWQDDQRLRGAPPGGTPADPAAPPRWRRVAAAPRLTWLDRRLAYAPGIPPDAVARSRRPTTMVEWDLPVQTGATAAHLTGTTTWQPAAARHHAKDWLPYAAGLAALTAAVTLVRRRTAR
jgi:hypothetical protein